MSTGYRKKRSRRRVRRLKNVLVNEISLVGEPAVPSAKFVIAKLDDDEIQSDVDLEKAATKTEDGKKFRASDYAYVPDPDKPSTWKLRLTNTPGGKPNARIVGAAVAALGEGFRGQKVKIPSEDLPAVKRKVRAAWLDANPDKSKDYLPDVLKGKKVSKEELKNVDNEILDDTEDIEKAGSARVAEAFVKSIKLLRRVANEMDPSALNMLANLMDFTRFAYPDMDVVRTALGKGDDSDSDIESPSASDMGRSVLSQLHQASMILKEALGTGLESLDGNDENEHQEKSKPEPVAKSESSESESGSSEEHNEEKHIVAEQESEVESECEQESLLAKAASLFSKRMEQRKVSEQQSANDQAVELLMQVSKKLDSTVDKYDKLRNRFAKATGDKA